jgi:organic hydroperoxide reductase OsmC/OhrA
MSQHTATVRWSEGSAPFTYESYNRDHIWTTGSGVEVPASSAPAYKGSTDRVNPEEALVAALSSCHMLTFLAIAAKKRLTVLAYEDEAIGTLAQDTAGRMAITRVELRPRVQFGGAPPDEATLHTLHERAHANCFIANSVSCEVVTTILPWEAR